MWVDYVDGKVLVNSALGRQKDKNLRRDPRVAITLIDPDNPYRYLEVRGKVSEITQEGADKLIDKLAKKYLDKDKYPFAQPGEQRVIYKIDPGARQPARVGRADSAAAKEAVTNSGDGPWCVNNRHPRPSGRRVGSDADRNVCRVSIPSRFPGRLSLAQDESPGFAAFIDM